MCVCVYMYMYVYIYIYISVILVVSSPLSFVILFIWILLLFISILITQYSILTKELSILYIFKKTSSWFCCYFLLLFFFLFYFWFLLFPSFCWFLALCFLLFLTPLDGRLGNLFGIFLLSWGQSILLWTLNFHLVTSLTASVPCGAWGKRKISVILILSLFEI